MSKTDYKVLSEISASQWGLITTAQAEQAGISRLKLSRLVERGQLIRLAHGVYQDSGAATSNNIPIKVAWLSTNLSLLAEERLSSPDIIVGGTTAAYLWNCGDLEPYPYQFYTNERKQTQRRDLLYIKKDFVKDDFKLADGLPVARIEFVIADLIRRKYDLSLVSNILREARSWIGSSSNRMTMFDPEFLNSCLEPIAKRNGHCSGDDFQEYLLSLIGESTSDYREVLVEILNYFNSPQITKSSEIAKVLNGFIDNQGEAFQRTMKSITEHYVFSPILESIKNAVPKNSLTVLNSLITKQVNDIAHTPNNDSGFAANLFHKIDVEGVPSLMPSLEFMGRSFDE